MWSVAGAERGEQGVKYYNMEAPSLAPMPSACRHDLNEGTTSLTRCIQGGKEGLATAPGLSDPHVGGVPRQGSEMVPGRNRPWAVVYFPSRRMRQDNRAGPCSGPPFRGGAPKVPRY